MVRLGQNFLADPNLLAAIVRSAELGPDDVVLEVGGGEGVLTERVSELVERVWVIELDRGLEERLGTVAAAAGNVEVVWGDAMKVDLSGLEPSAHPDGGQPAVLDRDSADPADDRRAAVGGLVDGDGPARDRRPAAGSPRLAHVRRARVLVQLACSCQLLRGVDRAVFTPRPRVESALLAARADGPGATPAVGGAGAGARSRTGARRWPGRLSSPAWPAAIAPRGALEAAGLDPAARAEALAPGEFIRLAERLDSVRDAARARQAQPVPSPGTGAARRAARAALAVLLTHACGPAGDQRTPRARRTRSICPGVEGPNLVSSRARRAARSRLGARAVRRGDRQADPGRRRSGRRQRRRGGVLRHLAAERDDLAAIAAELGADVPVPAAARVLARGGSGRSGRAAAAGRRVRGGADPGRAGAERGRGLRRGGSAGRCGREAAELEAFEDELRGAAGSRARRRWSIRSCSLTTCRAPRCRCGRRSTKRWSRWRRRARSRALVSGSGPTAVGLFADVVAADNAAADLPPRFAGAIVSSPQRVL